MKERPIIFSGNMVRAILDGRKTQTRRVMKPQPYESEGRYYLKKKAPAGNMVGLGSTWWPRYCPFKIGMKLWVRETFWQPRYDDGTWSNGGFVRYEAERCTHDPAHAWENEWTPNGRYHKRPSIFMPRWASRIMLEVTEVRVERVREISDRDALAESCRGVPCDNHGGTDVPGACTDCLNTGWLEPPTLDFMGLWDSINAKRGFGWDANPWVWVISFKRVSNDR